MFATIVEFSGITTQEINNSISFYDLLSDTNTNERAFVYTERSSNGLSYAIINSSYKLIIHDNGSQEFYNLSPDPYENNDLIGKIKRLKRLYKSGTLTKDEFEKAKNKLLK